MFLLAFDKDEVQQLGTERHISFFQSKVLEMTKAPLFSFTQTSKKFFISLTFTSLKMKSRDDRFLFVYFIILFLIIFKSIFKSNKSIRIIQASFVYICSNYLSFWVWVDWKKEHIFSFFYWLLHQKN